MTKEIAVEEGHVEEAPPPSRRRGGRPSRRQEVQLKRGPRTDADGLSDKSRRKMIRITAVAVQLARDGIWPSPEAVAKADPSLPLGTVRNYVPALDAGRRIWVKKNGPHARWRDPDGRKRLQPEADAEKPRPDEAGPSTDRPADAAEAHDLRARIASLEAELATANRRIARLIGERNAEHERHEDTKVELANERIISERALMEKRGPTRLYSLDDAEFKPAKTD